VDDHEERDSEDRDEIERDVVHPLSSWSEPRPKS